MILGLGGVVIDRSLVIPDIPGWDTVLHAHAYSTQQGGMVATALATSSRLGIKSEFVGAIGNDDAGGFIMKKFIENRVSCPRIRVMEDKPSPCSICLVNASTGTRTIIHYKGVQFHDSLDLDIDLYGIKILHLDGYWPVTALDTARRAREQGITVMLDPSSTVIDLEYRDELLSYIDYFMPGYGFGKMMTGEHDPEAICRALYLNSMKAVILTHGDSGAFIFDGESFKNIPAFRIGAVDTTGAGDVFHGAFMAGYLWGYEIEKNCIFANAAAALKCGKVGGQAGIPYKHDGFEFLRKEGYDFE
ncbi:MAG: carbohydrate kinase family protein [Spirochaetota bacterium]